MNRRDFIASTVASTLPVYLQRYCAPWKIEDAQRKCYEDAEKLADKIFGVVESRYEEGEKLIGRDNVRKLLK